MKFREELHRELLEQEARFCVGDSVDLEEAFVKRRRLEIGLADWERRQVQKQNWRTKRFRYMYGIRKFHRGTKGKEFHRKLGRFLATRNVLGDLAWYSNNRDEDYVLEKVGEVNLEKLEEYREFLISVTSLVTHALIEERYYEPGLTEAVYYKLFLVYLVLKMIETFQCVLFGEEGRIDWEFWKEVVFDGETNKKEEKEVERDEPLEDDLRG